MILLLQREGWNHRCLKNGHRLGEQWRIKGRLPSSSSSSSLVVGLGSQHSQDEMSSAFSLISLVGSEPRQREEGTEWACPKCTFLNPQRFVQCSACCLINPSLTNGSAQRRAEGEVATGNPSQQPADASVHSGAEWGRTRSLVPSRYGDSNIISRLPFIKIHDPKRQLPSDERKCPICMEEYEVGDEITTLPCLHVCHRQCINRWLARKPTCPMCKTSVSS